MTIPTSNTPYNSGLIIYNADADRNKNYSQFANAVVLDSHSPGSYPSQMSYPPSNNVPTASLLDLSYPAASSSATTILTSNRPHALSSSSITTTTSTSEYPIAPAYSYTPPPTFTQERVTSSSTTSTMDPFHSTSSSLVVYNPNEIPRSNSFPHQDMMIMSQSSPTTDQIYPEEDYMEKKKRRRRRRRVRMAVGAASGVVVGGVILGPIGIVAGAVTGVVVTRAASKHGEKRKDARVAAAKAEAESSFGMDPSQDMTFYRPPAAAVAARSPVHVGSEHVIV